MTVIESIWKYPFEITDLVTLMLPFNAKVLHVEMQGDQACVWVSVIPENTPEPRQFAVVGTGHPVPRGDYIGTFQNPPHVWHLFELR